MHTAPDAATPNPADTAEYLTVAETARILRLARSTVYANADSLGAVRVGNRLRIPRAAIAPRAFA